LPPKLAAADLPLYVILAKAGIRQRSSHRFLIPDQVKDEGGDRVWSRSGFSRDYFQLLKAIAAKAAPAARAISQPIGQA
jgi:hypothetical protein